MPSDLITLRPLAFELNDCLKGGKVDKITQPEKDEIRLAIRAGGLNRMLLLSANPEAPRVHFTTTKRENPVNAPSFCMHLRKYLLGAVIDGVGILEDRVIYFDFSGKNEMKDAASYRLYIEIMNRYSNIILTNADGIISDALKKLSFDEGKRGIMCGLRYSAPSQPDKINLDDGEKLTALLTEYKGDNLVAMLTRTLNGVAKITVTEILYRAGYKDTLDEATIQSIVNMAASFHNIYGTSLYQPSVGLNKSDFFVTPYNSMDEEFAAVDTMNEALQTHFSKIGDDIRVKNRTKHLLTAAKRQIEKLNKKLEFARETIAESETEEEYRKYGDLITCYIYKIKKGDTSVTVEDYFTEGSPELTVKLDEKLTPQQNAQHYYQRASKLKRGRAMAETQLTKYGAQLDYMQSILEELQRAEADDNLFEMENELVAAGAMRAKKTDKKVRAPKPTEPMSFEFDGYTVLVGKNNVQNDTLTFKTARSSDVWLHVKAEHGSHVIILGTNPPKDVILCAAALAAYYSSAREKDKVEVDYTERRNVRRIKGGGLGQVNYTDYSTVFVVPNKNPSITN